MSLSCFTCCLYVVVTAIGSFAAGALISASTRLLRQRFFQVSRHDIGTIKGKSPFGTCQREIRPPPKRRHSISIASTSEQSSMEMLANRHNRAHGFAGVKTTDATNKIPNPTHKDINNEEERDKVKLSLHKVQGYSSIRQKGRSFAASLRKLTLLHDHSIEQVP